MAVDPPTVIDWGFITEAELRAIPEFLGGYTNRPGIPDTKEGLRTRVNASWARLMTEVVVAMNNVYRGDLVVPVHGGGSAPGGGLLWRPGDDHANTCTFDDLVGYSIPLPIVSWNFDGAKASEAGGPGGAAISIDSNDNGNVIWSAENMRGGVSGEDQSNRQLYALRSAPTKNYWALANPPGIEVGGVMTVCGHFSLPQWNQSNGGVVLLSHRRYNGPEETGTSYRLNWEIGLGDPTTSDPNDLQLYYRDYTPGDAERTVRPLVGTNAYPVYLPWNREHHIAIQRYDLGGGNFSVRFILNGIEIADHTLVGGGVEAGASPDMRVVFGSDWDGLRHFGGGMRNVMIWADGQTQPTVPQLQTLYRVGAGFLPKIEIPQ